MAERDTSLRDAAGAIGLTPAGFKQFLLGSLTSQSAAAQLDRWYARYAAAQGEPVEFDDPRAALTYLMQGLPPAKRRALARDVLGAVARGYDESGKLYPEWLVELHALYAVDHAETSVVRVRRSAMGKYAHLNWSSEDYARRKQDDIDLEDGEAA
jgi:hypothetical protein